MKERTSAVHVDCLAFVHAVSECPSSSPDAAAAEAFAATFAAAAADGLMAALNDRTPCSLPRGQFAPLLCPLIPQVCACLMDGFKHCAQPP